jgi:hypothetical protein
MVPLSIPSVGTYSSNGDSPEGQEAAPSTDYFYKMLELYEIANHMMQSQTATSKSLGDELGLPRLYQNDEYFATAVKLDASLQKFENTIPSLAELSGTEIDDVSRTQVLVIWLR